ncbi:MAG TPA: vitamin K epoxide reductase family protein [Ktedonobacteraceae bacterium]|nr:vitamin K epoxide reductase family protein [Ktedonobacteraceae bacterium]
MTFIRSSRGQITLFVLSLLGIVISIYLTSVHYENVPLVCSTSGLVDCASVLSSPYSLVPDTTIPITVPGLAWCLVSAALAFVAWRVWPQLPQLRTIRIAQFVWTLIGILTVLYLVFVELVRLHRICAWCTALHVIIFVMLLITVVNLQEPEPVEEFDVEEEEPIATTKRNR